MAEPIAIPPGLQARARRGYEANRLGLALLRAWPAPPLVALALACCGGRTATWTIGSVLFLSLVALRSYGREPGRAALAGLAAGLPPFFLPLLLQRSGTACLGDLCLPACMLGCAIGGTASILALAAWTRVTRAEPSRFLIPAGAVAALTGGLGCLVMGGPGLAALGAGALLAAPALLVARGAARQP